MRWRRRPGMRDEDEEAKKRRRHQISPSRGRPRWIQPHGRRNLLHHPQPSHNLIRHTRPPCCRMHCPHSPHGWITRVVCLDLLDRQLAAQWHSPSPLAARYRWSTLHQLMLALELLVGGAGERDWEESGGGGKKVVTYMWPGLCI